MIDIRTITIDYSGGSVYVENPDADIMKPFQSEPTSHAEIVATLIGPKIIELMRLPKEELQKMYLDRLALAHGS